MYFRIMQCRDKMQEILTKNIYPKGVTVNRYMLLSCAMKDFLGVCKILSIIFMHSFSCMPPCLFGGRPDVWKNTKNRKEVIISAFIHRKGIEIYKSISSNRAESTFPTIYERQKCYASEQLIRLCGGIEQTWHFNFTGHIYHNKGTKTTTWQ